jgi:diguanylate cyclase (GGDEF)-like protein
MPLIPQSDASDAASQLEQQLAQRRLRQIASLTVVLLLIGMPISASAGRWESIVVSVFTLGFVAVSLQLSRHGRTAWGSLVLLVAQTACVTLVLWTGQGVYSAALLGYPAILIFASMLAGPRHLFVLLAVMLVSLTVMVVSAQQDLHSFVVLPPTYGRLLVLLLVLSSCAVALWLLSSDLRDALGRLKAEIELVNQSKANLAYLAQHDALTKLPNRLLGREYMEKAMSYARRHGGRVALMFIDLDNFKTINDSLGHSAGDEFLQQVAQRLVGSVRETDTVSRHGGDEFLVMLPDVDDANRVGTVVTHLLERLSAPYTVRDTRVESSCSIGIAVFPQDGNDFEQLLKGADTAMYHAKEAGRNTFRYFDEAMNRSMVAELNLTSGLRQGLARQEFELHYQPILDLAGGALVGAEALIRWRHPEQGMVPPMKFIPIAERSGLIVEIGEWVLNEACRQMVAWRAAGLPEFVLAVNLSMVQFRRGNIEEVVSSALSSHGLNPASLELELTESELIRDSEKFIETLQSLKAMGVRLSIDDFGTGYSNLSYLQRFEVNKLKVDQSFVRRLKASSHDRAIVQAIIEMAHALDMVTTAEGIEDDATRLKLRELGCDQGQGYLFARPQPAAQFEAYLRQQLAPTQV